MSPVTKKFILIALFTSIAIAIVWLFINYMKKKKTGGSSDSNSTDGKTVVLKGGKNNPGHLRYTNSPWKGKIYPQPGYKFIFESFDTLDNGVRAWLINAKTQLIKGYDTVDKFVDRLSPASDNPESARKAMKLEISKMLGKDTIAVGDLWKIAPIVFKYEGNPDWRLYGQNIHVFKIAQENGIV